MKTLKLARVIASTTGILAALGVIVIMIYGLEIGLNDYNLLGCLFIFFMSTLYTIAIDAEISKRTTDIAPMKKVYQTTVNQCVWMMVGLLIVSTLCLFL